MSRTPVTPGDTDPAQRPWVIEVNIAGFRVLRTATKPRHLIGVDPRIVIPPLLRLRRAEVR